MRSTALFCAEMMTKITRYVVLGVALLHGLCAWAIQGWDQKMVGLFSGSMDDLRYLPPLSKLALTAPWWLWGVTVLVVAGFVATFSRRVRVEHLLLALVALLAVSVSVLLACAVGYTAPFMIPVKIVE